MAHPVYAYIWNQEEDRQLFMTLLGRSLTIRWIIWGGRWNTELKEDNELKDVKIIRNGPGLGDARNFNIYFRDPISYEDWQVKKNLGWRWQKILL